MTFPIQDILSKLVPAQQTGQPNTVDLDKILAGANLPPDLATELRRLLEAAQGPPTASPAPAGPPRWDALRQWLTGRFGSGIAGAGVMFLVAAGYQLLVQHPERVKHLTAQLPRMNDFVSVLGLTALAGAVGGLVNGVFASQGLVLPRRVTADAKSYWMPGFLGNCATGAVAAILTTGAFSPAAQTPDAHLTLGYLLTALVIGMGGARVVTSNLDKSILWDAASRATTVPASHILSSAVASAPNSFKALQVIMAAPTAPTSPPPPLDAMLLRVLKAKLNRERLTEFFEQLAQQGKERVLRRDGSNLPLTVLTLPDSVGSPLREALSQIRFQEVGSGGWETFSKVLAAQGVDVNAKHDEIVAAWDTIAAFASWWERIPADRVIRDDDLI